MDRCRMHSKIEKGLTKVAAKMIEDDLWFGSLGAGRTRS